MVLRPKQVRETRIGLGLSQAQLANLLAVHPMTIYKWEASLSRPERTQEQLLVGLHQAYEQARSRGARKKLGRAIAAALVTGGSLLALAALLGALFRSRPGGRGR